jgi:hypothetical protein
LPEIGEETAFEEFSILLRSPACQTTDTRALLTAQGLLRHALRGWHREITQDYSRRKEIDAVSLVYYLTDAKPGQPLVSSSTISPDLGAALREAIP